MKIMWIDPPERKRKVHKNSTVLLLEKVKDRPDQWARIAVTNSRKSAYTRVQMFKRAIATHDLGEFEFTTRTLGNNRGAVWAKFIQPEQRFELF